MKTRTTISLPMATYKKIERFSGGLYNPQELALLCLKKLIRKINIEKISSSPTAYYNSEAVGKILGIRLTKEEHYNLKMYRILTGLSISHLTHIAIHIFITGLLRVLDGKNAGLYKIKNFAWLDTLRRTFAHIHRRVAFQGSEGKRMLGLHIVMPKESASWPVKFQPFPIFRSMPQELRDRLGLAN